MRIHELLYFALGNDIGRVCQDLHHAQATGLHHHLEGARVQEVTHKHAGGIAKIFIGCRSPAPQRRFIDHVVMQQGGRVNEFHYRRQIEPLRTCISEGAAHQQKQCRPQALAAGGDDVTGDFADKRDGGLQAGCDDLVHLLHVVGYQGEGGGGAGELAAKVSAGAEKKEGL